MKPRPSTIDTTHGVIAGANRELYTHRNLLDTDRFAAYLQRREHQYVSLSDSLDGKGDALTIDDSLVTAADCARLARKYGHAVTIFLNGYNIVEQEPYFFSRLTTALDAATVETLTYQGTEYDVQSRATKERFRLAVRATLIRPGPDHDRQDHVSAVGRLLGIDEITVPPHLRPLTLTDVHDLVALGVDIQNHGWTHARTGALPPDRHADDIGRGRDWLRATFGVEADLFAVPFGDAFPPWATSPQYRTWLMLDDEWPLGELAPTVVNRRTIHL